MQKILYILVIVFLFSCSGEKKEEPLPSYVLDKDKFSDLIADFTLAEAAVGMNINNLPGHKMDSAYAFNPLKDNNVTRKQFDTSMYYYCHHPELFKEVYQLSLEKLSKFQASRK